MKIIIIDYGMGNFFSVQKAFNRLGINSKVSNSKDEIQEADKLIIPGVGNFKKAMENLQNLNLIELLNDKVVDRKTPILGICLGMQLFTNFSEEGNVNGLGWIGAQTKKFPEIDLKTPHIGWNNLDIINDNFLLKGCNIRDQYYFVHSYYVECINSQNVLTKTDYIINFHSTINKSNIYGVQFHPEKSHKQGLKILSNFINLS